jgi:hypothetical protein
MPKWRKHQKEFNVSVTYHEQRGSQCYLPKPIIEILGKPNRIKFIIKNNRIEIESGESIKTITN